MSHRNKIPYFNIIKKLETDDEQVRDEVVSILESLGKKVADSLTHVLIEAPYKNVQLGAIDALGRIGDIESVNAIMFIVCQDPFFLSKPNALKALIRIGEKTDYERVIKYCLKELEIQGESEIYSARIIRYVGYLIKYATYSHKRLGEISKYKSVLIDSLYSSHRLVHFVAGFALFDLGLIRPILKALEFPEYQDIRKDAALILKDIACEYIMLKKGKEDVKAIRKALYRACVDDDKEVRKAAKASLDYVASIIKLEKNNKISKTSVRNSFLKIFKSLIITEEDCGCESGIYLSEISQAGKTTRSLKKRIIGRCCSSDVRWGQKGDIIVRRGEFITKTIANELKKAGKEVIKARSILQCQAKEGVCLKCFGKYNFAGDATKVGEKIGNKAASWWARLQFNRYLMELLGAHTPADSAIICESEGLVNVYENKRGQTIIGVLRNRREKEYIIPKNSMVIVESDDEISYGEPLTYGKLDPKDIFRIMDAYKLNEYILNEMLFYMPQSNFDERLVELFVRQTTCKGELSFKGIQLR